MTHRQLHNAWTRATANFTEVHRQLEDELRRMRERKVEQQYIDKKDNQIELLVDFFNQSDELFMAYRLALANANTENHFLTEMLLKKITLQELMEYRPSAAVKVINIDTQQQTTISSVNG
jgi:hypothetical protein